MRSAALTRPTPSWPRHAISRRLPSSRQPSWSSASVMLSVTERTAPGAGPIAERHFGLCHPRLSGCVQV